MKNGIFALYLGKEYSSGKTKTGKIILRSTDIKDIERGFEPCNSFTYKTCEKEIVCIKIVNYSDVEDYYRLQTKAIYAGFMFDVIDEKENKISIATMSGNYRDWLDLEMKCIDKGVYQKWININDAEIKIVKEQL